MRSKSTEIKELIALYDSATSTTMRAKVVIALFRADLEGVMDACRKDAVSSSAKRRYRAAWVLSELVQKGSKRFLSERVGILLRLLEDQSSEVRARAAQSLGILGTKESLRSLLKHSHDPDSNVRKYVAAYLSKYSSNDSRQALLLLSKDSSPSVREMAAMSLGMSPGNLRIRERDQLINLTKDRSSLVRHEAIRSCISRGCLEIIPVLLQELDRSGASNELVGAVQELCELATRSK
jgi:HEAT repeat protein